jgi:hypothetical protein
MPTGRRLIVWLGVALALSVAVVALLGGDLLMAVTGLLAAGLLVWWNRPAAPAPAHADERWARTVLARAGHPTGVAAVRALRQAEPALSLTAAKQLADRVAR